MIDDIIYPFIDSSVVVYLEGILIFSADLASHEIHVSKLLAKLRENYMFYKLEKYEFF